MAVRLGIDKGGAFTDPIGINDVTGELVMAKTPSTLSRPVDPYDDYTIKGSRRLARPTTRSSTPSASPSKSTSRRSRAQDT
jgi:N-methylhydantoinase A/oxoprolinase/acetone carboxylase beta subunit